MVAAGVGFAAVAQTLGYTMRTGDVKRAHVLAPGDGRVTALLAQELSGGEATSAERARADQLARSALLREPAAVVAVSTLGVNAQARGDTTAARRLFAYAETLSRRDLQTQIWALEDAVGRGDVAGALRHYDIALRTSRSASELLFPVLASAISSSVVRTALISTLAGKPGWSESFVSYISGNGPDARSTARLFLGLQRAGVPVSQGAQAAAVNALVAGGLIDDAWSYYATVRPGANRRMSRDPRFTAVITTPSVLDWEPINDAGVTTSIQHGDQGGVFDFAAPPSVGGPLLRQMQMLPPGDYRFEGRSTGVEQPAGSRPYWVLTCRSDGRELGRVVMPDSAKGDGTFTGALRIPAGCPVQVLAFVARPSDMVSGLSGQISHVRLAPAS